jgi:hypothetical protein
MSVPAPFLEQVSVEDLLDAFRLPKESLVNSTDAVMTPASDEAEERANGEPSGHADGAALPEK